MNAMEVSLQAPTVRTPLQHQMQDDVPVDTLRLLTQSALLAVHRCLFDDAKVIAEGLQTSFGDYLGVAMTHATVTAADGRTLDALELFKKLSRAYPNISAPRCGYAMVMKELDLPGWRALAEEVALDDSDRQSRDAALAMLEGAAPGEAKRKTPSAAAATATAFMRFS
jgi:hypothetical protein